MRAVERIPTCLELATWFLLSREVKSIHIIIGRSSNFCQADFLDVQSLWSPLTHLVILSSNDRIRSEKLYKKKKLQKAHMTTNSRS